MWIIILHLPIAYLIRQFTVFATAHALLTLALGLYWILKDRIPERVMYTCAYIVGSETLWRAGKAAVFWEYGKYSICLLLLLAMMKYKTARRLSFWPLLYFLLLVPSILALPEFDRDGISFNLSGPLTLAITAFFFNQRDLRKSTLKNLLVFMIAPLAGLSFVATFFIIQADTITFVQYSMKSTSAGFGPNQVASALGLGALVAAYFAFIETGDKRLRQYMSTIAVWLLAQSFLTFSRGGVWTTLGALFVLFLFSLSKSVTRRRILRVSVTLAAFFILFWPILNDFTGGVLEARFLSTDPSKRDLIIKADWNAFLEHPGLGVGPGQSSWYHRTIFRESQPHTEYSRLLAEHGILGLLSMAVLFHVSATRFLSRSSPEQRGFKVVFTTWAVLFMAHAAMRLAAPAFLFGLSGVRIVENEG